MTEGTDMNQIEKVARALAKADGLDFDEVCGVDANPDDGYCDSGTCVAAHWEEHDAERARRWYMHLAKAAIAAMPIQAEPVAKRWQLGDKVKKKANSSWRGVVCGFYNTPATPNGYSVVSLYEPGSVQVWPEAALEDWDGVMVEDELRAEITRLTEALRLQMEAKHKEAAEAKLWFQKAQEWKEALRAAEEREKGLRHHWAALDKALTDNIIETDQPHRVRWEGEWHYGPLADAYFAMTSVVRKLARQALAGAKP